MRKLIYSIMVLLLGGLAIGCTNNQQAESKSEYAVYYISNQDTKVVSQPYKPESTTQEEMVQEFLLKLKTAPTDLTAKKTIPDSVNMPTWEIMNDQKLIRVKFDSSYSQLKGVPELLRRAAIVKTLCQITNIDYVEFYVAEQPLMDADGGNIGLMKGANFIDNTGKGFNYIEDQPIELYYASEDGNSLVEKNATLRYDGTVALEKLVINQLIAGPVEELNWNVKRTVSEQTECVSVTTYNNICYVEFNEKFLDKPEGISDEVALYSVVNSLVNSLSSVNKVQISVKGQVLKSYGKLTNLPQYLEHNFELAE